MRTPIGSQCKSFMTGVIWSDLLIPETKPEALGRTIVLKRGSISD